MALNGEIEAERFAQHAAYVTGDLVGRHMFAADGSILDQPCVPDDKQLRALLVGANTMALGAKGSLEPLLRRRAGAVVSRGFDDAVEIVSTYVDTADYADAVQEEIERQASIVGSLEVFAVASAAFFRYLLKGADVSAITTYTIPTLVAAAGIPSVPKLWQLAKERRGVARELATTERVARAVSGIAVPAEAASGSMIDAVKIPVITPRTIHKPIVASSNTPYYLQM